LTLDSCIVHWFAAILFSLKVLPNTKRSSLLQAARRMQLQFSTAKYNNLLRCALVAVELYILQHPAAELQHPKTACFRFFSAAV
jgi:hypothetical protein